jgi:DNA (cytosine-5)-methyltransferase 1
LPNRKLTVIDLFCGAGGLSLGLRQAGFRICAAFDNDPAAIETYRSNLGTHGTQVSIYDLTPDAVMSAAGLARGECDLLAGGPPCQGFSLQRRGPRSDTRNNLVLQFLRMVEGVRPRMFLMENVPGILSPRGKALIQAVVGGAERLGYIVTTAKLDAVHFSVPQFRTRVFVVGKRDDCLKTSFEFPRPNLDESKWRTVRDAIGDLPLPPRDGSCHPEFANHYREKRLSARNLERLSHIPPGGGREHLPEHLQLDCHKDNPTHRHLDVYGRLAWTAPSVTLTARFDSFSRGRFAHPEDNRSITLREGARIQTFPDDFVFYGNREECARQIGNAVPPQLSRAIGGAIAATFRGHRRIAGQTCSNQMLLAFRSQREGAHR